VGVRDNEEAKTRTFIDVERHGVLAGHEIPAATDLRGVGEQDLHILHLTVLTA
jgi:hypothetical protein